MRLVRHWLAMDVSLFGEIQREILPKRSDPGEACRAYLLPSSPAVHASLMAKDALKVDVDIKLDRCTASLTLWLLQHKPVEPMFCVLPVQPVP